LWVETKTDNNKSYYYHAVSRESLWEPPVNAFVIEHTKLLEILDRANKEDFERQLKQCRFLGLSMILISSIKWVYQQKYKQWQQKI
jgi:hypothetical protein